MKDDLQTKLAEIIGSIQTAAGKASDFAMEQLPDIAQSYVLYGRVVSAIWVLTWLAVAAAAAWAFLWLRKNPWNCSYGGGTADSWYLLLGTTAAASPIAAGIAVAVFTKSALVWFAPKVWLLKELATLIK